jgi:hypothetical protein
MVRNVLETGERLERNTIYREEVGGCGEVSDHVRLQLCSSTILRLFMFCPQVSGLTAGCINPAFSHTASEVRMCMCMSMSLDGSTMKPHQTRDYKFQPKNDAGNRFHVYTSSTGDTASPQKKPVGHSARGAS